MGDQLTSPGASAATAFFKTVFHLTQLDDMQMVHGLLFVSLNTTVGLFSVAVP